MNKYFLWGGWIALTIAVSSVFAYKLLGPGDKETFLIGPTTYGHYQIEMTCETCHTTAFGGEECPGGEAGLNEFTP